MTTKSTRHRIELAAPVRPQVLRLLRERIITGALAPRTRLSEAEIAMSYGVSRQPIREAFIKLADEGLIEVRPQRGTFVLPILVSEVMDARFVREAIEADIVTLLATDADQSLLDTLQKQIAEQKIAVDRSNHAAFMSLDETFHRTLAEATGKIHAWRVIDGVKSQMDRVRYLSTQRFPMGKLVSQHEAIVAGIASAIPTRAEEAMRNHLREILSDLPQIAAEHPVFFDHPSDL